MDNIADKKEKNNRTERINLRLTPDELNKLTLKADSYNLPVARYLRDRILELPPPIERVHDLPTVNAKLMRELRNIGNNVNQLAKFANTEYQILGSVDTNTLQLSIDRIRDEIRKLREMYSVK